MNKIWYKVEGSTLEILGHELSQTDYLLLKPTYLVEKDWVCYGPEFKGHPLYIYAEAGLEGTVIPDGPLFP